MSNLNTQNFATYLRTVMFLRSRLNDVDILEPVHVPIKELKGVRINVLIEAGEIEKIEKNTKNERKAFFYKALKKGPINPSLLKSPKGQSLNGLTKAMRSYLKRVSLKEGSGSTDYFNFFLFCKNEYLNLFFTADLFSGRVHTPISSFHREYRPNILIDGEETASFDVATMQPLLLGKILEFYIGVNEYSQWIEAGKDIYVIIQEKENLDDRDMAKKLFYKILFSYADERLAKIFGNANWINWINDYKSRPMEANPHTQDKQHSNLAWLLQTTEVKIMREVWQGLVDANIVFLSVHDEIIVKIRESQKAEAIFNNILSKHFKFFKLNSKGIVSSTNQIEDVKPNFDVLQVQANESQTAILNMRTIDQFYSEAIGAFNKTLSKDRNKFLICWANDIKMSLLDAGITPSEFVRYCAIIN